MDSSINLEAESLESYVLGQTPAVPMRSLDLASIFEVAIARMKPSLQYLPCFKPLTELLNGVLLTGCATRKTFLSLVEFPDGRSERTKVVEIQVLEEADIATLSTRKSLLLANDGVMLIWSAVYDRPLGDGNCRLTGGRDEVAKESRFEVFDVEKLRNELSKSYGKKNDDWRRVILRILDRLSIEMSHCIENREQYLKNMKSACDKLDRTRRRIQRLI